MKKIALLYALCIAVSSLVSCGKPDNGAIVRIKNYTPDTIIVTINPQYPNNISEMSDDYDNTYIISPWKIGRLTLWKSDHKKPKVKQVAVIKMIEDNKGEVVGTLDFSRKGFGTKVLRLVFPDDFEIPEERIVLPVDTLYFLKRQNFR